MFRKLDNSHGYAFQLLEYFCYCNGFGGSTVWWGGRGGAANDGDERRRRERLQDKYVVSGRGCR